MDRKLFVFTSTTEENMLIGVNRGLWALRGVEPSREKQRKTLALEHVDVGDYCMFKSDETDEFTSIGRILEIPRVEEKIQENEIWRGGPWSHPVCLDILGSLDRRVPTKELRAVMPHVTFSFQLPFLPANGLSIKDLITILGILGDPNNVRLKYVLKKLNRLEKKEAGKEIVGG